MRKALFARAISGSLFARKVALFSVKNIAEIAQLVEHDLAKVGVAGSSPVFRSTFVKNPCAGGEIGIHATLRG